MTKVDYRKILSAYRLDDPVLKQYFEKVSFEDAEPDRIAQDYINLIIVLRSHPDVLRKRLEERNYSEEKLRENLEAEAIDVILEEALETGKPVYEIDTTEMNIDDVKKAVEDILSGRTEAYRPGKIDFSEVILSWY